MSCLMVNCSKTLPTLNCPSHVQLDLSANESDTKFRWAVTVELLGDYKVLTTSGGLGKEL